MAAGASPPRIPTIPEGFAQPRLVTRGCMSCTRGSTPVDPARQLPAAVIFDIGGVLELTPATGWQTPWAAQLGLEVSELEERRQATWAHGAIGAITLQDAEQETAQALGLDGAQLTAFMNDLWLEYLGTLNEPLAAYFAACGRAGGPGS